MGITLFPDHIDPKEWIASGNNQIKWSFFPNGREE
jgi:hypothetical protein